MTGRTGELLDLAAERVERALEHHLDRLGPLTAGVPARLLEAMRYSLFSGGKRVRPALVFGAARAVHAAIEDVLPAACAVEMIHTYSLVHDDLPTMDDDDVRRGRPSCHRKFDEATALLAGDALLAEGLALIAAGDPFPGGEVVPATRRARATAELARAIGTGGMVGGQLDDLSQKGRRPSAGEVRSIHLRKTARLIEASVVAGAIYGGGTAEAIEELRIFGREIGLAFQLVDDVLDGDGIAAIEGPEAAREEARATTKRALSHLTRIGPSAAALAELADVIAERAR
jgi:geranylgeranyl pyrophosphate synthase